MRIRYSLHAARQETDWETTLWDCTVRVKSHSSLRDEGLRARWARLSVTTLHSAMLSNYLAGDTVDYRSL